MRCFIAIELDEVICQHLGALRKQLQTKLWGFEKGLKWVKPDNYHLTMKFLGDVDDSMIMDVCRACDRAAQSHQSFDIELGSVGTFPNAGAARVIWAGLTAGIEPVRSLYNSLEEQMHELRFNAEEKKFNPHTTLARIKLAETGRKVSEIVANLQTLPFGIQTVEHLTIFQSVLENEGAAYNVIHKAALK